ncbi:MAG TPA: DNA helicase UvrD, partial [Patescibacteria group bacterium]|nr:DNA helicase UvrD [Patescibacteria group bacterium]
MKVIADLHIHSKYARACSKDLNPQNLAIWADKKGITVLGTGDFTHPLWLGELKASLEESEQGLYKLKGSNA